MTKSAALVADGEVKEDIYLKTAVSKGFSFSITISSAIIEKRRIDSRRMITAVKNSMTDILKYPKSLFNDSF